jgi:hypothetical protein
MTLSTYSDLSAAIVDFRGRRQPGGEGGYLHRFGRSALSIACWTCPTWRRPPRWTGRQARSRCRPIITRCAGCYLNGLYTLPLEALTLNALKNLYPDNRSGIPLAYAIDGPNIVLGPLPNAACTLSLKYKQKIQGLSGSNTTNWLLTKHPDLYLLASLVAAELRGWNDNRLPTLKGATDEMIMEINAAGKKAKIASGPLRMRATVTETGRNIGGDTGNLLTDGASFLVDG